MSRALQVLLILSTLIGSWFGMQAIHEAGHVLGAWLTDAQVRQVVLHPFTISRTDLGDNPRPLLVVWAGPLFGVLFPLVLWALGTVLRIPGSFVLRFFAGFCLLANGLYIGVGAFDRIGDAGVMLRHGSEIWQLWLFGLLAAPAGLFLWHGQGRHFGLGAAGGKVDPRVALGCAALCLALLVLGFAVGGN